MKRTLKILTLTFLTGSLYAMEQSLPDDKKTEEIKSPQAVETKEIPSLRDLVMQTLAQFYSKPYDDKNEFTLKAITSSRSAPFELIDLLIKGYMNAWPLLSNDHKKEVAQYFITCGDRVLAFTNKLITILRFCMNPAISKENKGSFLMCCSSYIEFLGKQCEQLKDKKNKTPHDEAFIKTYEMHEKYTLPLAKFFLGKLGMAFPSNSMNLKQQIYASTRIINGQPMIPKRKLKNIEHFNIVYEPTNTEEALQTFEAVSSFLEHMSFQVQEPDTLAEAFELLGDEFYNALFKVAVARDDSNQFEFLAKRGKLKSINMESARALLRRALVIQWRGYKIVHSLLSNGCSPLVKDESGQTFLHKAIAESNIKIAQVFVEFLLKRYSSCLNPEDLEDQNLPENLKDLLVFVAIIKGDDEAASKLITKENINTPLAGTSHVTPLWIAALCDNSALTMYCINKGANLIIQDGNLETLLHQTAKRGLTKTLKLLLAQREIGINALDHRGTTALFCAVEEGYTECVRLLLEYGADVTVGESVLDEANKDDQEMMELLRAALPAEENALEPEGEQDTGNAP